MEYSPSRSLIRLHILLDSREEFCKNLKYMQHGNKEHVKTLVQTYNDAIDWEIRHYIDLQDNKQLKKEPIPWR